MNRFLLGLLAAGTSIAFTARGEDAGFLIQLGLGDKEPTIWNGSLKVSAGQVTDLSGWRFDKQDKVTGKLSWQAGTRAQAVQGRANNPKKLGMAKRAQQNLGPIAENGVFVRLRDVTADSVVEVTTKQGNFSFKTSDVKDGDPLELLDGKAAVQRTAIPGKRLSPGRTEDDFPAMAVAKDMTTYVTYQSFTPGIDRDERAKKWTEDPGDLSFLAKPAGGDQLWLQVRKGNQWPEPVAVTEKGRDIYKSAVAVDGQGVVWIAWSERQDGNFDILARSYSDGKFGDVINLSKTPGSDVSPVAACDGAGKVWIAWQGASAERFNIYAKHQTDGGKGWSESIAVSSNTGNCWQPSIAANEKQVSIAWDTYERGDYDVWLRQFANDGTASAPQAAANSELYEARPSLCYDHTGALWVAWEKSGATWGKDWGAYDSADGVGLYRDRQIGLRVLKDGQWMEPQGDLAAALPSAQPRRGKAKSKAADFNAPPPPVSPEQADGVNPDAFMQPAMRRGAPGEHAVAGGWNTFNNLGRLGCDIDGRMWCIVRTRLNSFRGPVGSTWVSYAAYLNGSEWVGPILVPHSDNLIYNLPALATGKLALFIAHATDHRMDRYAEFLQGRPGAAAAAGDGGKGKGKAKGKAGGGGLASLDAGNDPFDNDVYFSRLTATTPAKPAVLKPAVDKPRDNPPLSKRTIAERDEIKGMRAYHTTIAGKNMQIMRGEFHRHTEISGDGAGDGPLEDMWRYAIDAACMDWIGNGDHDNGNGREYTWWLTQKTTDAFHLPGLFTPMFSYERSVSYPEGHRNCVFAQRGVRTLPRLPMSDRNEFAPAPDTTMLYKYLHLFNGVCASHTSVGSMGTDWRNNDPEVEPMVEVYQGARQNYEYPGCPRCPTADDAIGGWEPAGFICNAFAKGYKFAFESSSDHGSTHISYAMVYAEDVSREGIIAAMRKRHTYGATDNIIADTRCKAADGTEHMMGDEFSVKGAPTIDIKLTGTMPFAKITIVKDNVEVQVTTPNTKDIHFAWTDPKPEAGKTSYYYVRGEQTNGELVWCSPMWIKLE